MTGHLFIHTLGTKFTFKSVHGAVNVKPYKKKSQDLSIDVYSELANK